MRGLIARVLGVFSPIAVLGLVLIGQAPAQEFDVPQSGESTSADVLPSNTEHLSQTSLDCSHLVHYLYTRAGLPYSYAPSHQLYNGVRGFRRVRQPRAGDLVAWRGHVGIVVDPEQHSFLSKLRSGVKVSSYLSRYWQKRGQPRFLRYALADVNALGLWTRDDSIPGQTIFRNSSGE